MNPFLRNRIIVSLFVAFFAFVGYGFLVYAAAPTGGYYPGLTLDPGGPTDPVNPNDVTCTPGSTNCLVNIIEVERSAGAPASTPAGSDAIIYINESNGDVYSWDSAAWNLISTGGTVTSIGLTVPTGLSVTGSPVTSSGTLAITTALSGILIGDGSGFSTATISSPLSYSGSTLSIANAAADGATKGASTYTAADFNASSGLISIDYTNGQAADTSTKGFLTSTDWNTFNGKENVLTFSTGLTRTSNTIVANLIGATSGLASGGTVGATTETWLGNGAGASSGSTTSTVFIGINAGSGATSATSSNFIGSSAGLNATGANNSIFIGSSAGSGATSAHNSRFLGTSAGLNATGANNSNFFGTSAGSGATSSSGANFFGPSAGLNASSAGNSNFLGPGAGLNATSASYSNFLGSNTGSGATGANNSNFFGLSTGQNATNASYSNFIGAGAGAYNSGTSSGSINSANSIFIGRSAGAKTTDFTLNNVSPAGWSILIGNDTSTGGYSNSIALGANAVNTATKQFMVGSTTWPIDSTRINGSSSTECTITTGTGIACTSDERLKTNIVDLDSDTLEKLLELKTVTYNWSADPNGDDMIGFLAQNLEEYFPELVATDGNGFKSVYYAQMTPILVEAIRELKLDLDDIADFAHAEDGTFLENLIAWLGDVGNGIIEIFAKKITTEQICVTDLDGETCLTRNQIDDLLQGDDVQIIENEEPVPPTEDVVGEESVLPENDPEGDVPVEENTPNVDEAPPETGGSEQ